MNKENKIEKLINLSNQVYSKYLEIEEISQNINGICGALFPLNDDIRGAIFNLRLASSVDSVNSKQIFIDKAIEILNKYEE